MAVHAPTATESHLLHFRAFGFVVLRQLFEPEEIEHYGRALEAVMLRLRGGTDFAGIQRQSVEPIIEEDPDTFYPLLDDCRLLDAVEGILGEDCLYTGGNDGNLYVGDTRWHSDSDHPHDVVQLKTAIYCDPVADGAGCLSVIPGSHHSAYSLQIRQAVDEGLLWVNSPDWPGRQPLESSPGDIVAFDHRLWHSSWGGKPGRRMFTFNWVRYPKRHWEETWLYGFYAALNKRNGRQLSDRLWNTAGRRRKQKIAKFIEMGL